MPNSLTESRIWPLAVTRHSYAATARIVERLMGNKPEERFNFITGTRRIRERRGAGYLGLTPITPSAISYSLGKSLHIPSYRPSSRYAPRPKQVQ